MTLKCKLSLKLFILLVGVILCNVSVQAQCSGCTTVITGGSSNFSVNVGQVVCIGPSVTYTGNITLNGGTLCNQGTLTKINFKKGNFENYGTFADPNSLAINTNGYLRITNHPNATFSVGTGMSITSSTGDTVAIYNRPIALFTSGTALSANNVIFKVFNGDNVNSEPATFNIGAAFSIGDATEFVLRNYTNGNFNVAGNLAFNATGNKSIINHGLFNVNNAVTMSGTGNSSHLISITNNSNFNVTGNISTAVNNSGVLITNNFGAQLSTGISLTLSKTTNTLINNGNIMAGQDFIVQNAKAYNGGYIYSARDIKTNTGTLVNTPSDVMVPYLVAGRHFVVQNAGSVYNDSYIYATGNLQITSASFTNSAFAQAIVSTSVVAQNTASIANNGTITCAGVVRFVSSSFINGSGAFISSGLDFLLQTGSNAVNHGTTAAGAELKLTGSQLTNNNIVTAVSDILPQNSSSVTNNATITTQTNLRITTSTLTNNNYVYAANNFSTTNASAVVNNNGFIDVGNEFRNIATVNLVERSTLRSTNFYNLNTGTINGGFETPNIVNYARIFISGFSQSSGFMNNSIVVWDNTLTSTTTNNGYGFDQVSNGSRISPTVVFTMRGAGVGSPPVVICNSFNNIYNVATSGTLTSYCSGSLIPVTSQAQQTIVAGSNTITNSLPLGYNSYTWQPGNVVGQTPLLNPNATTTYTVFATLPNGCVISGTLLMIVNTPTPPTIVYTGTPWTYSSPSALTFPVTLNGPTGGFYSATPAGLNINSSTGLITALGSTYGTYTVSYTTPESGNCYSMYTTTTVVTLIDLDCHLTVLPDDAHLCEGDQIQLTASGGADGYTWTPSAGLSCTNCPAPILTFSNSTTQFTVTSTRGGTLCGTFVLRIFARDDCQDNSIIGCCFSNYGAGVYINDKNTHINVYCNVVDEIANLMPGPTVSKGKFESYGNLNFTKDWIHNGQNDLYVTNTGTTMTFGNIDQNMKGNTSTHFNKLTTDGNGLRTIWINEYAYSDLDLVSNELVIQNYNFYMKNPVANVYRTSGFASTGVNGYFSRLMDAFNINPNKTYLFPLGTRASTLIPFRYRPIEMLNNRAAQGDEVSGNFMNIPPSLATDFTFINANPIYTNVVTNTAPPITQVNNRYYHKLKNTVPPPLPPSDLIIRSYYPPLDGSYQSIAEWEKNNLNTLDWWGQTPGASANNSISTNAGTFGQMYASSNGTVNFDGSPFCLAISSIYVNTSSFGGNPNTVVTINPAPSNNTAVTTSSTTNVTNSGTVITNNTTTTSVSGGVTTSTTTSTTGTLVTTTTSTVIIVGGNTTNTTVTTTGTNVTVVTSTTAPGIGGTTTNTTSTTTGTLVTTTTSTTSPTVGNVSSSTVTSTGGGTTTTTTSTVVNNGNTSTTTSSVVTVVGASTVVVTTTCVTVGSGNSAITTCSTQTQPNTNITVTTNTVTTVASNTTAVNTTTNVYNPGPLAISSNPTAGDYIMTISTNTLCDVPGKIKFTVTPGGTINPNSVQYSEGTGIPNFSVNLSDDVFTINNVTVSLTLHSTPKDILAQCVNSVNINTSMNNDYVLNQSTPTESIVVNVPFAPITGLALSTFTVYDSQLNQVGTPVTLSLGTNNVFINHNTLPIGVYSFLFEMYFTLPSGSVTEKIKGQFVIK